MNIELRMPGGGRHSNRTLSVYKLCSRNVQYLEWFLQMSIKSEDTYRRWGCEAVVGIQQVVLGVHLVC